MFNPKEGIPWCKQVLQCTPLPFIVYRRRTCEFAAPLAVDDLVCLSLLLVLLASADFEQNNGLKCSAIGVVVGAEGVGALPGFGCGYASATGVAGRYAKCELPFSSWFPLMIYVHVCMNACVLKKRRD